MRLINNLRLKHQISLLILIALIMMILLQSMYSVLFNSLTRERAAKYAEGLMGQVALNVDTIAKSVERDSITISYSKYVQELLVSDNIIRNADLKDFVSEIFTNARSSNQNIYSIVLLNNKDRQISDSLHYNNDILKSLGKMYNFQSSEFKKAVFSSIVRDSSDAFYYYSYISPIFSSLDMTGGYSKIGSCIFLLDTRELEKLVNTAELTNNSLFLILDSENRVIVSNKGLKAGDFYEEIFWQEGISSTVKDEILYEGQKSIVQYKKIESTDWKVISVIPIAELTSDMKPIVSFGIWLGIIMIVLLTVIGSGFIYNTTRPVMLIVRFLSQIGERNIKQRLRISSKNEVGIIATNINQMLDKVEAMTSKIVEDQTSLYEAKLSKKQAELSALQSQINPHFLYNTLNCLSNIGLAYNVMEVVSISSAMSRIFRYSIKGEDMVSIKDEMSCIKDYLLIMDIRYNGKFETVIHIEESILENKTLKMVLQPIVENAMYHGLEMKNGEGRLLIQGFISESGYLQMDIEDNGVGMNEEQLSELLKSIRDDENMELFGTDKQSIGLGNINKRIKLQFGPEYGLDIVSEAFVGTKVTIRLPVIEP
ncbi:two-component system, sensor histidine kinase YesM [Paenibacillus sp. 1_12]|uniref:sensor histidine kinase n=1 Tax=Paenibacillus sp. 1_12 TaxID=1566278 RepID=UPI0008E222D9|nr:histidine kinase [Paenibacillus sp. 1_12]SFL00456.1 two-component system, sensor histidine kinase YesM [Paenibacillus sp. 1_12]